MSSNVVSKQKRPVNKNMKLKHIAVGTLLLALVTTQALAAIYVYTVQPLSEVLEKIGEKYKVVFSYSAKDLKHISVEFSFKGEEALEEAINRALANTNLKYKYLGANFFVVHKNNKTGKRKLKKIKRKIQQIERLGESNDISISNRNHTTIFDAAENLQKKITIKGKVTDTEGTSLIGATVKVDGTTIGTSTEIDGSYELSVPFEAKKILVTYTGYSEEIKEINRQQNIDIVLKEGINLKSVTVFGSRGKPRTSFDSPVPVDHISTKELNTTGKNSIDQQLMFKVPSFNSTQQPVSDATAHFNPADLRGLLPSRTLVLVNGKRKNSSALVYSVTTAGRGEVGVDLKSISPDAIESVEILREGAAAQYGSDAVAGVINLVLKKNIDPYINMGYSTTSKGDGTQYKVSSGFSTNIKENGFVNYTFSYSNQRRSQRAGNISSPEAEAAYFDNATFSLQDYETYLNTYPKAGAQVGLPDMSAINFSFNGGYTLEKSSNTELYAFGTSMNRKGASPQFARVPYWVSGFEAIYPDQAYFLPEMAPKIIDNTLAVGIRTTYMDWDIDFSSTYGRNKIDYYVINSFNQSLGAESPKNFYNGTHSFSHLVNNLDAIRTLTPEQIESLTLSFGIEQRTENFKTEAGEFASYGDGTPNEHDRIGSESFSGFKPENASSNYRSNLGLYAEINADLTKKVLLGAAMRFEHYNDFGSNFSWKLNGRFKAIENKLNLRGSLSNGFRAPALHQIYYTATTTSLTQDGIVQNRIFNNLDPTLKRLGIPRLMPETSINIGAGFTYKLTKKIGFAADLYKIFVQDRIILSGQVVKTGIAVSPIDQLLNSINTSSAGFFLNAVNTTTKGIDLVLSFEDMSVGTGNIKGSIAANFNRTQVDDIHLPNFIVVNDLQENILSREDISRIESWRPRQKIIATSTYIFKNFATTASVFYYGSVFYQHPTEISYDAKYNGKILSDVNFTYTFADNIEIALGVNNIFNIYPDTFEDAYTGDTPDPNLDFVGRFKYPWQTTQFGIDGRRFFTSINYTF